MASSQISDDEMLQAARSARYQAPSSDVRLSELESGADAAGGDGHQEMGGRVELVKLELGAQEDILNQRQVDAAADRKAVQHLRVRGEAVVDRLRAAGLTDSAEADRAGACTAPPRPVTETFVFATPIAKPTKP